MITVAGRRIGLTERPFIVAEMSANHNQSLDRALRIVDAAAEAGVDAVKLQTATPQGLTLDIDGPEFRVSDPDSPWYGKRLFELYQEAATPWEWHSELLERACERGLIAFSTPFEEAAVDFLEELEVPLYKIASFENADLSLIRKVAATGKPLIISTGMATLAELDESVREVREAGCTDLVLLKCTSTYPATPDDTNISTIPHMRELFGCEVGLSDHTLGIGVALASVALGATVIEKHFTLARADGGVDSAFSMEPAEMKALVKETDRAWRSLGRVSYGPTEAEKKSIVFRRSLYVTRDVQPGDALDESNVRAVRPGHGLAPRYLDQIIGMKVTRPVKRGTPVTWDIFRDV